MSIWTAEISSTKWQKPLFLLLHFCRLEILLPFSQNPINHLPARIIFPAAAKPIPACSVVKAVAVLLAKASAEVHVRDFVTSPAKVPVNIPAKADATKPAKDAEAPARADAQAVHGK